ncbi:unnamed protein product, partial [Meganyctiphanes norvegica]
PVKITVGSGAFIFERRLFNLSTIEVKIESFVSGGLYITIFIVFSFSINIAIISHFSTLASNSIFASKSSFKYIAVPPPLLPFLSPLKTWYPFMFISFVIKLSSQVSVKFIANILFSRT